MPVRRSDEEPLQKLMSELRGELDLKARVSWRAFACCHPAHDSHARCALQDAKFLKLHPAAKKALILLTAQISRQTAAIPDALQEDFSLVIGLAPALLDELITILLRQRPPFGAFMAAFCDTLGLR